MQAFHEHIDTNRERYLGELYELVSRPSIAAQNIGIEPTAMWVAQRLERLGAEVRIIRLPDAAPVVWASLGAGPRTLLVYDHYDVQPPEPLEGWTSPPFEPTERDGKLYARGVADNKSNLLLRIQALESWLATIGPLPLRVNFLLEGEEEIGSVHLDDFCSQHPELLQADGCLWETGGVSATEQPTIHCGAKGICYVELRVRTAADDLHSANATVVPNAAWRLTWALATLKDRDERVLIPGFFDAVRPPSEADLRALETIPNDEDVLLKAFGIPHFLNNVRAMDYKKAFLFNPTCTICGLDSGYTGQGSKTVLPAEARAKIDFRLVPDMDPAEIVRLLRAHLDSNGFGDIEIIELGHERAARSDLDSAVVRAMRTALEETYGRAPIVNPTMAGTGPMYPVCAAFGTPVTSGCGTGYIGTRIHAPDENIRLDDYWLAMRSMGAFVRAFALES